MPNDRLLDALPAPQAVGNRVYRRPAASPQSRPLAGILRREGAVATGSTGHSAPA
eukprot:COSAG02_NODE_28071_length_597_cov_0.708835_1_plen_54_part_01